jgi:hypothetical protein
MPLWVETLVLMLIVHALGLAAGWLAWGAERQ